MSAEKTREELLEEIGSNGYRYEQTFGNCPQCVLASVMEALGDFDDAVFKASFTLAGGGGLSAKGTCGALVGGLMAIASRYGRDREHFDQKTYRPISLKGRELLDRFVAEYGSPICGDVQTKIMGRSFDLTDPDEYHAFELAGGHDDKCPSVVRNAAVWTAEILLEMGEAGRG